MKNVYKYGQALIQDIGNTIVPRNAMALWHLGQEGFVIKGLSDILYIDPYLSNSIQEEQLGVPEASIRDFPPPIQPTDIDHANYVLCTHFHQDHMDRQTLYSIVHASPQAHFVIPASHLALAESYGIPKERIILARDKESLQLGEFLLTPIAERHQEFETDELGNHFYLGFVLEGNGVTIYHSGDTIYFPELSQQLLEFQIDIALINSNGRDWVRDEMELVGNMNYKESLEFARRIKADLVVPMHYDMFAANRENPAFFVDYLFSRHRDQKFHMFAVGERFIYHR
ncbi:MAG: MBL fold metallo-hydrolase [Bacilli bacterium]